MTTIIMVLLVADSWRFFMSNYSHVRRLFRSSGWGCCHMPTSQHHASCRLPDLGVLHLQHNLWEASSWVAGIFPANYEGSWRWSRNSKEGCGSSPPTSTVICWLISSKIRKYNFIKQVVEHQLIRSRYSLLMENSLRRIWQFLEGRLFTHTIFRLKFRVFQFVYWVLAVNFSSRHRRFCEKVSADCMKVIENRQNITSNRWAVCDMDHCWKLLFFFYISSRVCCLCCIAFNRLVNCI